MSFKADVAGRFAREALADGYGEVCASFRRSFYLRCPGERYACLGDASLGHGPLNVLVTGLTMPAIGERMSVDIEDAQLWTPPPYKPGHPKLDELRNAARDRVPAEGLGCLVLGSHNALSGHAQPALEALERWLVGNALGKEAEQLIGLGPGLTPSGDDYLGGMLVALRVAGRGVQADGLWRWLQPRLNGRTSAISAAHLTAAAAGEAHEALHDVLNGDLNLEKLDAVGHCSGWDALAGALAVLQAY
ncbi:MAG: hypothetical protein A3G81_07910 [Betaproteobacteria bacterium RIFCSPLOWO2_12_FULL_65_14]|nr:MAG: hypothetical protein A3G81_07910 [Betaproteobacteria bacterium RIFCSPLOWO2_12_FULL_65_14]